MSFVDVPNVFIGRTDDGHTFVVLNRSARSAGQVLTAAGFTARQISSRTVYLLAPTTSEEANERVGIALYGLLAFAHDVGDPTWTTWWNSQPAPEPDLRFVFAGGTVTATAETGAARSLLEQHGFEPSGAGASYQLPTELDESRLLGAVDCAESHACALGLGVRVDLGIATPDAIPAPRGRASHPAPGSPATRSAQRRSH
ncbi:hypothetical protein ACWEL8_09735 [Streptomyces sp. NPDC004690]